MELQQLFLKRLLKAPVTRLQEGLVSEASQNSFRNRVCFQGTSTHDSETVFECPSAAGILSSARSGLGVALINGLHLSPDLEVVEDLFPEPPSIAYVARSRPKTRNDAVKALVQEISREVRNAIPLRVA